MPTILIASAIIIIIRIMNFEQTLLKKEQSGESKGWNCSNCTFINSSYLTDCELCGQNNILTQFQQCNECSAKNKLKDNRCEVCDSVLGEKKVKNEIVFCYDCGFENHKDNQICLSCGSHLKLKEQDYARLKVAKCPICDISLNKNEEEHIKACEQSLQMIQNLKLQDQENLKLQIKPIKPIEPVKVIKPMKPTKPYTHPYVSRKTHELKISKIPTHLELPTKVCQNCQTSFSQKDYHNHVLTCLPVEKDFANIARMKPTSLILSPLQKQAIQFMQNSSKVKHDKARTQLKQKIFKLGFKQNDLEALEHYLQNYAPIIVHIHISKHMQFFVKDTHYRNQFQTGKSSGTLSRDSRNQWENRMFSNKYSTATDYEKVKYGTINFTNDPAGVNACKSYGNSYLLLKDDVRSRCTFTDMDSSNANSLIGTFKYGDHILFKLSDSELKAAINAAKANQVSSSVVTTYKEIQIHGPLQFARDVQRLYVSKSEYNTPKLRNLVQEFSIRFGVNYQLF